MITDRLTLRAYVIGLMSTAYLSGIAQGIEMDIIEKEIIRSSGHDKFHNKGTTEAELLLIEFSNDMMVDLDQEIEVTFPNES